MEFSTFGLTAYVLVWPVIVTATLFVIIRGYLRDAAEAKRKGRDII